MNRVLLTGATTLVGAEVLRTLQSVDGVRPHPHFSDLREARFGLSVREFDELAAAFDVVIHCAQRETTDHDLAAARQANVFPIESWIHLLERNPALRLHHLSTAFVGGTRRGLFTEFDLECGQQFHNAYERSKFEAEVRLRESRVSDRVTIYRPSHVLGRASDGEASQFGGSYPLIATLAVSGILPGDARARIDFVPADYVAAALVALALAEASGTFHLACGWETSLPVRDAARLIAKGRDRARGARLLPRAVAWPLHLVGSSSADGLSSRRLAFTTARDLLHQGPVFDTFLADRALAPLGITRPAPEQWLETVVRHAESRRWKSPAAAQSPVLPTPAVETAARPSTSPAPREKRFHQVGDVNLAYRDLGDGEPVVFLHGFAGADAWDEVVERIAAKRRTLVIETLGLGDTQAPASADHSLSAQAARVRGLLSSLGIASAHIVGNDVGGAIAGIFAVRWPQCAKSLVLSDCDTSGRWPPPHLPALLTTMPSLVKLPILGRSRLGFGPMVRDKRLLTRERLASYAGALAGDRERRARLRRFLRTADPADIAQLLAHTEVPTMIVWGADDAHYSPSWARTLYDTIPGARRLELIPFAGISCHEERPDLFAKHLETFFESV